MKLNLKTVALLTTAIVSFSGSAMASSYSYGTNAAGTTVTAPEVTKQASAQTAGLISARVSSAVSSATGNISAGAAPAPAPISTPTPTSSLQPGDKVSFSTGNTSAAGDVAKRFGAWANAGVTHINNDQAGSEFSGNILTGLVGGDYLVNDYLLVGLSGGYEHGDIDTTYNNGTLTSSGVTVAPYLAVIINKYFSIDTSFGHTWVSYDESHGGVTGSTNGSRYFATVNGNANTMIDNWQLGSSLGFLYTKEDQDAYSESNGTAVGKVKVRLGQARATERLGYLAPVSWGYVNPYGWARLEYDVSKTAAGVIDSKGTLASHSNFGTTFGLGVNFGLGDYTTLNVEGTTTQFRENLQVYGGTATIRVKF